MKKTFAYKLHVNKLLRTYAQSDIDIDTLVDGNIAYINDVFRYLIDLFNQLDINKTNNYVTKLLISIQCMYTYYEKKGKILDEELIKLIREAQSKYNCLVTENNIQLDKNVITLLNQQNDYLNSKYPSNKEKDNLSNNYKLNQQLVDKDNKIENLNKQLSTKDSLIEQLQRKVERLKRENKTLNDYNRKLSEKKQKILKLNKQLIGQNSCLIDELDFQNELNTNLQNKIFILEGENSNLSSKLDVSNKTLEQLNSTLKKQQGLETEKEKLKLRKSTIDEYILSKLLYNTYTIDSIFDEIKKEGLDYSREEIKESLQRIKNKVNILNPYTKTFPLEYKVSSPLITTGVNFHINNTESSYDILLTSDWHLYYNYMSDEVFNKIDNLYNYCIKNNIKLILDLGDFLHVMKCEGKKRYYKNIELLDKIIEKFPYDSSIIHAILGGNHDRYMLEVGVDILNYLETNRNDFISLGYDDAQIIFNQTTKQIIGLHHPNLNSKIDMNNYSNSYCQIENYLNQYYKKYQINKEDIFINFFGHFHTARIDPFNLYATVPPCIRGNERSTNSVWHLKIYFDKNNNIDYMIIKNLSLDKKIEPTMDLVYTKK